MYMYDMQSGRRTRLSEALRVDGLLHFRHTLFTESAC